jgi:hypothetical protein
MLRELGAKTTKQLPAGWEGTSDAEAVSRAVSTETSLDEIEALEFDPPQDVLPASKTGLPPG